MFIISASEKSTGYVLAGISFYSDKQCGCGLVISSFEFLNLLFDPYCNLRFVIYLVSCTYVVVLYLFFKC